MAMHSRPVKIFCSPASKEWTGEYSVVSMLWSCQSFPVELTISHYLVFARKETVVDALA